MALLVMATFTSIVQWVTALGVVCLPFIKMAMIWLTWQAGIGLMAWGTARFYAQNCAAAGVRGYFSSLFSMGSPVCISAWFSHAAFVVAYVTAFIVAILFTIIWLWNRVTKDPIIVNLKNEISTLRETIQQISPKHQHQQTNTKRNKN